MTAPAANRDRTASAPNQVTALVLGSGPDAQLPDLSKPANLVKFAALFSGDQLSKLSVDQQAVFLTTLGNHLGVRAELGEIMLYQGKPYITIDGRIRIAHNSGLLNGVDAEPSSLMDRSRYGVKEGEHLWKCLVWKKGALRPFTGWGHVRLNDRNPVSKTHPQEMAKKRSKYDALRLAFPPKEEITPLHEQYIQEAEDESKTRTAGQIAVGDYDDPEAAPDDRSVLGEEIAAAGTVTDVAATVEEETPSLDEELDLNAMTLDQAKATKLIGPEGSWNGKVGSLLDSFSVRHLEQIRKWLREKIEEKGEDRDKEIMATAITLILNDRSKDQTKLKLDPTAAPSESTNVKMPPGGKVADALPPKPAAEKKTNGDSGLPF